jgi:uncharacterized protein GlcG (DUF336 family)
MKMIGHLLSLLALAVLTACGSGGGGSSSSSSGGGSSGGSSGGGSPPFYIAPALASLSVVDVQKIVAQAALQASADSSPATIAVVDRVGNVLALFRMTGAPALARITPAPNGANIDLQGLDVPAEAAAVAKAITGAYLSSGGNAFSSRTASMIVQQHFPPAPSAVGLESGPLYGVQFSQLPCSDLAARFGPDALIGPKRSPLGLAADPGGFPLYKNGVLVGGVGVLADGNYGFDPNVLDTDSDVDERIALAGTVGFEAPAAIRANMIYVDGTQLRYSDADYISLAPLTGASYATTDPALGSLVPLIGYYTPLILAGTAYGSEASGVRDASNAEFANPDAYVLSDGAGGGRFPIRAGTDGGDVAAPLTAIEARIILTEAFAVMSQARAQIRQPLDSRAQVSISLVDTRGAVLGLVRSPDAPLFGVDVSLQKARSAAFLSNAQAGVSLLADPSADVRSFVGASRSFLNDPNVFNGSFAISNRAIGNLARPYFPDGQVSQPNGPLSRPIAQFNPFSTGLQSALVLSNLIQHVNFASGASGTDTQRRCTFLPDVAAGQSRLQNGLQIFPGAVPIYRGNVLIGAIGVSGDGIDQDDMISFLGLSNASKLLSGPANAPPGIRSDTILVPVGNTSVRLRYVNCPFAPFIGSSDQNVCQGL